MTAMTPPRRGLQLWRTWSWILIGWTLFSVLIGGVILARLSDPCSELNGVALSSCQAAASIDSVVAVLVVFAIYLLGVILISAGWLAQRPALRLCPPYGHPVPEGSRTCPTCGYDFITAEIPVGQVVQERMADPGRPGPGL
jgi:hypothetical protein